MFIVRVPFVYICGGWLDHIMEGGQMDTIVFRKDYIYIQETIHIFQFHSNIANSGSFKNLKNLERGLTSVSRLLYALPAVI